MKKILIIGCGLLGSSLLRRIQKKKIANKIYIYEKSKSCIAKIKRLKLPGIIVKRLEEGVKKSDLIILCTPMSEYKNLILKMNKFLLTKTIITDVGSSKLESSKIIKKFLRKDVCWTQSHPIAGSEVSGPEHGKHDIFEKKWCVLIKEKSTKKEKERDKGKDTPERERPIFELAQLSEGGLSFYAMIEEAAKNWDKKTTLMEAEIIL